MVPECEYDGGACNSKFPSSTDFDNYINGRHRGSDDIVTYDDVNLTAYKVKAENEGAREK